jgi:hypothetical protein
MSQLLGLGRTTSAPRCLNFYRWSHTVIATGLENPQCTITTAVAEVYRIQNTKSAISKFGHVTCRNTFRLLACVWRLMSNTALKWFTFRAVILFNRKRCMIDCLTMHVTNSHRTQLLLLFDRLCYSPDLSMCILSPIGECKCLAIFKRWRRHMGIPTSMCCVLSFKLS